MAVTHGQDHDPVFRSLTLRAGKPVVGAARADVVWEGIAAQPTRSADAATLPHETRLAEEVRQELEATEPPFVLLRQNASE